MQTPSDDEPPALVSGVDALEYEPTERNYRPGRVEKWHRGLTSNVSIALAYLVWFGILGELAYTTYYVRVMRQVSPRIEASGDGCATICFVERP